MFPWRNISVVLKSSSDDRDELFQRSINHLQCTPQNLVYFFKSVSVSLIRCSLSANLVLPMFGDHTNRNSATIICQIIVLSIMHRNEYDFLFTLTRINDDVTYRLLMFPFLLQFCVKTDQNCYMFNHSHNPNLLLGSFTGILGIFEDISLGFFVSKPNMIFSALCLFHSTGIIKTGKDSFSQQPVSLSECQEISL